MVIFSEWIRLQNWLGFWEVVRPIAFIFVVSLLVVCIFAMPMKDASLARLVRTVGLTRSHLSRAIVIMLFANLLLISVNFEGSSIDALQLPTVLVLVLAATLVDECKNRKPGGIPAFAAMLCLDFIILQTTVRLELGLPLAIVLVLAMLSCALDGNAVPPRMLQDA
jgi:hypothetical protein